MSEKIYDLGEQPIAAIMAKLELTPHDLVAASTEQLAHKMVSKACKGRRLTMRVKLKVQTALNKASGQEFKLAELFNY